MKRREFLALLGGAAAAWPLAASAQQAVPVIGILAVAAPEANAIRLRAFREGLRTAGYVEGQNVKIEYRWAEAHTGRLPELAAGLVRDRVAVLVTAGGTASAVAAKAATREIPIVFGIGADPVEVGLVASLNRPGGNVTGVTSLNIEVAPKRLELMHELLPSVTSMALLVNPAVPATAEPVSRSSQAAAQALGLQLHTVHASSDRDFAAVFERLTQLRVGALVIGPDTLFTSRSEQLAKLTVRHEMPAIYEFREFAAAGGLMSYGSLLRIIPQPRHGPQRPDCVAGVGRLELRNVDTNYVFERWHRFAGIQQNSGFGDYSRLSCGAGDTQLGRS
jgi:putative tryptophan/tyrosine transport system substrate-binding protein